MAFPLLSIAASLSLFQGPALPQASIAGTVRDGETRAPIAGAAVVLSDLSRAATADSGGHYLLRSFEAGKNGARAGIIMRAHPKVGLTTPQESAPGVAEDQSRVVEKSVTLSVPYGTLRHCIKTEEFTPLEPDVLENKWYCRGVGVARERDVRGGDVTTALTAIVQR